MEKQKCPDIRFMGSNGDWVQSNLAECTDLLTGNPFNSKEFTSNGIFLVRGMNVKRGYLDKSTNLSEYWPSSKGLEQYLLKPEDIVIQMDGALIGKSYAKINSKDLPALLVQRVTRVRSNNVEIEFIYQYIHRDFLSHISGIKTETAVPHLSLNDIRDFTIFLPEKQEQSSIGNFFQNLDQSIALQEKKLAQTQNLKKAMLEKMFPKAGSTQPEIRLKGFSGDWELKSLSDVSEKFEYGLNAQATTFDGINKYIRITDIDDESRKFILDDITSPNICFENCEKYKLSTGDILFARTGASVGKTYIYLEEDGLVYFAGFLIRAKVKDTFDANFIFTNTLTERFNKFVMLTSQRSGQPGINAKEYGEYEFYCPNKDEQESIGNFFRHLDETLLLQQQKLQSLKNLKQAFLEKMFV